MQKQPNSLFLLKAHIVEHLHESQTHKALLEKKASDYEPKEERLSRAYTIGINIGRIRYNGIKQGISYLDFEKDLLLAHLNKSDIGYISNSCDFGKALTDDINMVMKSKIVQNNSEKLSSTGKKRPVGLIADEITPNKRTRHKMGLIVPYQKTQ